MKIKKTLVLGASLNPSRYSFLAIGKLIASGHTVVAIGNREGEVSGVSINTYRPNFKDIDTVTLYINPSIQEQYYEYVLSLKPNRVIFNPGTENAKFYKLLSENDISYEVACTLVLLSIGEY